MSEYTYDIDKYTIGVDGNGEDGIGLTVAKIENGEIHFLGNCYGENARCIDLLIKENQELKKELEEKNKPQIFIDTQDIEERYAEGLYQDYLEEENKKYKNQQKEFIEFLENEKNINPYDISDYTYEDIINTILSKYYEIIEK